MDSRSYYRLPRGYCTSPKTYFSQLVPSGVFPVSGATELTWDFVIYLKNDEHSQLQTLM